MPDLAGTPAVPDVVVAVALFEGVTCCNDAGRGGDGAPGACAKLLSGCPTSSREAAMALARSLSASASLCEG